MCVSNKDLMRERTAAASTDIVMFYDHVHCVHCD